MPVQFTFAGETALYDGIGEPAAAEALAWAKRRWPVQLAPLGDQHIRVRIVRELGEDAVCYEVSIRDAPPAVQAPPIIIADERLPFSTVLLHLAVQAQVNTEAKRDPLQHALVHVTQLKADDIAGHQACEERKEPYIIEHPLLGVNIQLRDIISYTSGPPRLAHWRCLGGCRKRHGGINYHGCGIIGDPLCFPAPLREQFKTARKQFIRKLGQHFGNSKAPDAPKAPEVAEEAADASDGDDGDDDVEEDAMQLEAAAAPAAAANARALQQVPRPGAAPRVVNAGAAAGANRPPRPRNPAPAAAVPFNPMPLAGSGHVDNAVGAPPGANPVIVPPPVADQDVLMEHADPALNGAARQAEAAAVAAAAMPRVQVHRPAPARRAVNASAAAGVNRPPPPGHPAPAAPAAVEPIHPMALLIPPLPGGGRVDNAVNAALGANLVIIPPPVVNAVEPVLPLQRGEVPRGDAADSSYDAKSDAMAAAAAAAIEEENAEKLRTAVTKWRNRGRDSDVVGLIITIRECATVVAARDRFAVVAQRCEKPEEFEELASALGHLAAPSLHHFEPKLARLYRQLPQAWFKRLKADGAQGEAMQEAASRLQHVAAAAAEGGQEPEGNRPRGPKKRKAPAGGGGAVAASVSIARSSKKKQRQGQAAAKAQQNDTEED